MVKIHPKLENSVMVKSDLSHEESGLQGFSYFINYYTGSKGKVVNGSDEEYFKAIDELLSTLDMGVRRITDDTPMTSATYDMIWHIVKDAWDRFNVSGKLSPSVSACTKKGGRCHRAAVAIRACEIMLLQITNKKVWSAVKQGSLFNVGGSFACGMQGEVIIRPALHIQRIDRIIRDGMFNMLAFLDKHGSDALQGQICLNFVSLVGWYYGMKELRDDDYYSWASLGAGNNAAKRRRIRGLDNILIEPGGKIWLKKKNRAKVGVILAYEYLSLAFKSPAKRNK